VTRVSFSARMYMAPDPHDVLYENLAEDDINASSWKWLGTLDEMRQSASDLRRTPSDFFSFLGFNMDRTWTLSMTCGLNTDLIYWLVVWNMAFMTFHSLGNVIIPTDSYFFTGVGQPPSSLWWNLAAGGDTQHYSAPSKGNSSSMGCGQAPWNITV